MLCAGHHQPQHSPALEPAKFKQLRFKQLPAELAALHVGNVAPELRKSTECSLGPHNTLHASGTLPLGQSRETICAVDDLQTIPDEGVWPATNRLSTIPFPTRSPPPRPAELYQTTGASALRPTEQSSETKKDVEPVNLKLQIKMVQHMDSRCVFVIGSQHLRSMCWGY